jgi:hypothetical protein
MASSKKTLDLDTLTFENIYVKAQSGLQVSSFTIPVIPGNNTIIKKLEYLTAHQTLSVGNIYITESTIPNIVVNIENLSINQLILADAVSSLSTNIGSNISSIQSTTNLFFSSATGYTYGPTYSNLINLYNSVKAQNVATLNLQSVVLNLGLAFSTISTQYSPDFSSLGFVLEQTFNQGRAISTMSTYFSGYFNGLAESIPTYSNAASNFISTAIGENDSTITGFTDQVNNVVATTTGTGISTFSTILESSLISYLEILSTYDTSISLSTLSTNIDNYLSNVSTQFDINSGIPGICSISTIITEQYLININNAQVFAGTPGICTLSTVLFSNVNNNSTNIGLVGQTASICTFSTLLQLQINNIANATANVGYTYTILQQEVVKISISTLSTSFGNDYQRVASLSSFSTMLPAVYSTINSVFTLETPYSTIERISTIEASNFSTLTRFISSSFPLIFTGPGLSSLSTSIGPNFSSISTSLQGFFIGFSNAIGNISSVRADPGVSTLSTFFYSDINIYGSSFSSLYTCTNTISASNTYLINLLTDLSNYDVTTYETLNPADAISTLYNELSTLNIGINEGFGPLLVVFEGISTSLSTNVSQLFSSYNGVQSTAVDVINLLINSYTAISSVTEFNLFSPIFSTFTTDRLTTSTLVVTNNIIASSIGLRQSTSSEYPFAMQGGARFLQQQVPQTNHILIGGSNLQRRTSVVSSNAINRWNTSIVNQFSNQGNDIAYNGALWVAVGSNAPPTATGFIKYTTSIGAPFINATYPNINASLTSMNTVKWNGSYWLAGGEGEPTQDPTLLTSLNGITWSDALAEETLKSYQDLSWNGYFWAAVGSNPDGSNILYTDINGVWNKAVNSFGTQGNAITNNGRTWVAVGEGSVSIKYSYNGKNWDNVIGPQLSTGYAVVWNGDKFLAGGSNGNNSNLMYSYNGINWSYVPVSSDPNTYISDRVTSILWNGSQWCVAGVNDTPFIGVHMRSADAMNWSTIQLTNTNNNQFTTGEVYAQAYASNTIPTIQLSNFDIYSGEIPAIMDSRKRMNIIQSTIYFNDGDLTIRRLTSTVPLSYIGINTTYPEYALDIAVGNARKPVGSTWLTASDERVKTDIISADLASCAKIVLGIPLRKYSFTDEFQKRTGTSSDSQYGFIAQEVKKLLPEAIHYTKEYGLDDFHSLDTDQIFKLEFGATQYLLNKIQAMEAQVSTLEFRFKKDF